MRSNFYHLLVLIVFITQATAQRLLIIDFWTELPIPRVAVIYGGDSLFSSKKGTIDLSSGLNSSDKIILQKQGYYSKTVQYPTIDLNIVKMTPVESSAAIEIYSDRIGDPALMTPTHLTFLSAKSLQEQGMISLAQALSAQTGVSINSYGGAGQLQTISLRGMSAEQTQLFVDGIPVNNMQLGSADPGQYNFQQIEQVEIYRGGNTRFGGAGTIGGAINLKSRTIPDTLNYSIRLRGESLQNQFVDISLGLPTGSVNHDLSFSYANGQNKYSVQQNMENIELKNRDFERWNIRYRSMLPITRRLRADLQLFTFKFSGGSPSAFSNAVTENRNQARISYDNNLAALSLKYDDKKYKLNLRSYLRNEWNDYTNPNLLIAGDTLTSNHFNHELGLIGEALILLRDDLFFHTGIEATQQNVRSSESGNNSRKRSALFLKGEYNLPWQIVGLFNTQIYGSLRTESWSDIGSTLLPGSGLTLYTDNFKIFTSYGKNFRVPTFNELYWIPGGNQHLKPEKSTNFEIGSAYGQSFSLIYFEIGLAYYSNQVENQIRWVPSNSGIWSPRNILQIRSRGLEFNMELSDVHRKHRLITNYSHGNAIKTGSEFSDDPTVGNLLPYIPEENWSVSLLTGLPPINAGITVSGSSFRYLSFSNDPYDVLPSFFITRCWLGYSMRLFKQIFHFNGGIENVFDNQYQVAPGYPMPPRHFYFEFKLTN